MAKGKYSTLREIWAFMRVHKRYWLAPIIIGLLLLGALLVASSGTTAGQLVYTLF